MVAVQIKKKYPPLLKYPGGKHLLAKWIISHFPEHISYCEPFAGASSVLLQKDRVKNEILNDLDDNLVALLRVMSDKKSATELIRKIRYTAYAESVMRATMCMIPETDMEKAWKIYCISWMSRSYHLEVKNPVFRIVVNNSTGGHAPAKTFSRIRHLYRLSERLRGVQILQRDYRDVMRLCDRPDVLIYMDPSYLGQSRGHRRYYNHELISYDDHSELLEIVNQSKAMIVLSGYRSALYDSALREGWHRNEIISRDGSVKRNEKTEVLWINEAAARARKFRQ